MVSSRHHTCLKAHNRLYCVRKWNKTQYSGAEFLFRKHPDWKHNKLYVDDLHRTSSVSSTEHQRCRWGENSAKSPKYIISVVYVLFHSFTSESAATSFSPSDPTDAELTCSPPGGQFGKVVVSLFSAVSFLQCWIWRLISSKLVNEVSWCCSSHFGLKSSEQLIQRSRFFS